jgi:hypothetical protein
LEYQKSVIDCDRLKEGVIMELSKSRFFGISIIIACSFILLMGSILDFTNSRFIKAFNGFLMMIGSLSLIVGIVDIIKSFRA